MGYPYRGNDLTILLGLVRTSLLVVGVGMKIRAIAVAFVCFVGVTLVNLAYRSVMKTKN